MNQDVLERKLFQAGNIFLTTANNMDHSAFMVHSGEVLGFMHGNGKEIEVAQYGPGSLIAETNLLIDEPLTINYKAITDTTVIVLSRHDFEKKLKKVDSTVQNVIRILINKVSQLENKAADIAEKETQFDEQAYSIVSHLLRNMDGERYQKYSEILLPQFNVMCKALEEIKRDERHVRQKKHYDERLQEIKEPNKSEAEQLPT